MQVFHTHIDIRQFLRKERCNGTKIGLIPTMGALHSGHLSLIKLSQDQGDLSVASVFVNPAQFNNATDLEKYPRTLERDLALLESAGCDVVFVPSAEEMYPIKVSLNIDFGSLETELEGKFRPGHFSGVGLVISKLFNMVQPDNAYFGQKDLQQFHVIKSLVDQLSFPVTLHRASTMREAHGLAMSSRNERLSAADRQASEIIYKALVQARGLILEHGEASQARQKVLELFENSSRLSLEYFEVISTIDFMPVEKVKDQATTALCLAAEVGGVRLIDNLLLIS